MEDVRPCCCVCLEPYNSRSRVPLSLPCRHHICAQCSKQPISACPLCRQQIESSDTPFAVDQQVLAALSAGRMPSPSSHPIPVHLLPDEDAPGTPPYPSAPSLMEIQPCADDEQQVPYNRRATPSSLHRSSPSTCSSGSSIDMQPPSNSSSLADAVTEQALVSRPAKLRSSPAAGRNRRSIHSRPLQLSVDASLWQAAAAAVAGHSSGASTRGAGGNAVVSSSGNSLAGSQQGLLSFPVDDLEQEDCAGVSLVTNHHPQPGSPRSWPMQDDDADAPAAAAGAGTCRTALRASMDAGTVGSSSSRTRRRSAGVYASTQAAVQAVAAGAVAVLQQLAVPGGGLLDQEVVCHSPSVTGWSTDSSTLPRSSVVVAALHSSFYCWASYSAALQRSLRACQAVQYSTQAAMERLLQQIGLSGYGQLAWYWTATWVLGFLLYHWQLGLQLLPVAAASLALSAVAGMRPLDDSNSSSSEREELLHHIGPTAAAGVAGGSCRSHRVDVSSSSGGGSSSGNRRMALPVWPSQAAGGLLAADCCMAGLLLCVSQLTGCGSGLLTGLLAATPRLLAVVLLLLGGQVVVDVLCRGWWGHRELRHTSLLCRCWLVAAAGVLAASSSASTVSALATAAAWVQKLHMLLVEGPVFVLWLGALLQPLQEQDQAISLQQQQQRSSSVQAEQGQGAGSSSQRSAPDQGISATATSSAAAVSSASGASALLCCLHFLLQLLVLLFVPPGPLASAAWLPQPLQGLLVWGARVLLCGAVMQLVLRAFGSRPAVGPAANPAAAAAAVAASAPAAVAMGSTWGSPSAPLVHDHSSGGWYGNSSCGGCQQQSATVGGMGTPCCGSPSPRGRKGWELVLHGSHHSSPQHYSSGCGSSSHALPDAALGCGAVNNHHGSCSSWALAGGSADCSALLQHGGGGAVSGGGGALGLMNVGAAGLPAGASAAAAGVYRLLWRHAPYLLLLAAAFAGDSFITAATPTAAAVSGGMLAATQQAAAVSAGWAVRAAWQRFLQSCMVAGLCVEVLLMVRREVLLLLRLPLFPVAGSTVASSGGGVAGVSGWQPPSAATAAC